MRGWGQGLSAVGEGQGINVEIVENLNTFGIAVDVNLRHRVECVKHVGLCVEDVLEALSVVV